MPHDYEEIPELLGHTFQKVTNYHDVSIDFTTTGYKVRLLHVQDCCEDVEVEDVTGDLADLVGSPLLRAEVRTHTLDDGELAKAGSESATWTFYELATVKGSVTIRFVGASNGFYSESVSVETSGFVVDPL